MSIEQEQTVKNIEQKFLPVLQDVFQKNLVSVILYGSAVKGTFTAGVSDVNILILLEKADPKSVVLLGKSAAGVIKKNRINPLLLTKSEFLSSADVFPMEYLDITDSRKVIFGTDPVGNLNITSDNLRHQVEEQLRGTVSSFRRALLASKGQHRLLKRYLAEWFGSQNALIRGLLRLSGSKEIPADFADVVQSLTERFGIDAGVLSDLQRIRSGEKLDATETAVHVLGYLTELARKVDEMES